MSPPWLPRASARRQLRRFSDANRRERGLATLAARGFGGSPVPDARPALGAGPLPIQRRDALQRGFHFARSGTTAACVDCHVERRPDVGLQVHQERLERLQQKLRPLRQRTPYSLEKLADLPLVVRLAASEGERRPQGLADLL